MRPARLWASFHVPRPQVTGPLKILQSVRSVSQAAGQGRGAGAGSGAGSEGSEAARRDRMWAQPFAIKLVRGGRVVGRRPPNFRLTPLVRPKRQPLLSISRAVRDVTVWGCLGSIAFIGLTTLRMFADDGFRVRLEDEDPSLALFCYDFASLFDRFLENDDDDDDDDDD